MSETPQKITDHLANERTFLAWIRTSLGLIGLGFVLARMGLFLAQFATAESAFGQAAVRPVSHAHSAREFVISGVIFLMIGIAFGAWGGVSYHANRLAIENQTYKATRRSVFFLTMVILVGGLALVGLVLWRSLEMAG